MELTLEKQEGSVEQESLDTIKFRDAEDGEHEVYHPLVEGNVDKTLKEEDEVKVALTTRKEDMSFSSYLERIGVTYARYFRETKVFPDKDTQTVLRDLHQEAVDRRTEAAVRKHKQYTAEHAEKDNLQQETAKNHAPVFLKTINDLGIDGLEAKASLPRQDYLDGIDEIIEFDPEALVSEGEREGEKVSIGIQRSFRDKGREVISDPVKFFPEDPDHGVVFRVFIKEELEDYVDGQTTLMQKLLNLRADKAKQAGVSPKALAKKDATRGLPTVSKVLEGGVGEQIDRTKKVLNEIRSQLNNFIESTKFKKLKPSVQKELKRQAEILKIDKFIDEVSDMEGEIAA